MTAVRITINTIATILLTLIIAGSFGVRFILTIDEPEFELEFAASDQRTVPIYSMTDNGLAEVGRVVRGTLIKKYDKSEIISGKSYSRLMDGYDLFASETEKIEDKGAILYMSDEDLSNSIEDVVREKEIFIRTPATIYSDAKGPSIASFAQKGCCMKVSGYDMLFPDGRVQKYKVAYDEPAEDDIGGSEERANKSEGYIYSKYTVLSKEDSELPYNENGIYDKAVSDAYGSELYGGKAENLDYYPAERPNIQGNEFCSDARAMYINGYAALNPAEYVRLIKETDCNAVVIDIKDGYLAYKSKIAKKLSPTSYKTAYASEEEYKKAVSAYKDTGAYLIGRIVVFNDKLYAADHPEECIEYKGRSGWPSAYSRRVWEYNVMLAIEAAKEFGFNEIQFDYVRFPENAYEMSKSGKADFKNKYDEEKGQAVQNFCIYAAEMLHEEGVYMSVDVFGESAYGYMTAYGQYWPGISNVVDAISAMPYTDHMGADGSWKNPYKTMLSWADRAKAQQDKLENPAAARTWITGYDTPYWKPVVDYDDKKLKAQAAALKKAGLTGGYIPWNAASDLAKYKEYKSVWNRD